MQALKEITQWPDRSTPNHVYLLDGNNLVAYIRQGTQEPKYFKNPIKGFSKSGRKFETVSVDLFEGPIGVRASNVKEVVGSKGDIYIVDMDAATCTCSGYTYRGTCKHVKELA